jgi:hypothetical protein
VVNYIQPETRVAQCPTSRESVSSGTSQGLTHYKGLSVTLATISLAIHIDLDHFPQNPRFFEVLHYSFGVVTACFTDRVVHVAQRA